VVNSRHGTRRSRTRTRTHKIPIGVIKHLTGKREPEALDGKPRLFELLEVSRGDLPTEVRPVIVAPSSGGEVRFGTKLLPDFQGEFSPGEYLAVLISLL
jgi:hypothetical protein